MLETVTCETKLANVKVCTWQVKNELVVHTVRNLKHKLHVQKWKTPSIPHHEFRNGSLHHCKKFTEKLNTQSKTPLLKRSAKQ